LEKSIGERVPTHNAEQRTKPPSGMLNPQSSSSSFVGRFPAVPAELPPLDSFPYPLIILAIRPDPQPTTRTTTKDEND
jgi:hypothetical protein